MAFQGKKEDSRMARLLEELKTVYESLAQSREWDATNVKTPDTGQDFSPSSESQGKEAE